MKNMYSYKYLFNVLLCQNIIYLQHFSDFFKLSFEMKNLVDFPDAHLRIFERPPLPPPDDIKDIYLIGICGTGMGSLAGLLQQAGYRVSGSDQAVYPPMSTRLSEMSIPVFEGFDPAHLDPAPDLVVVGNACTPVHPEAAYAREKKLVQLSFPEALAHFFIQNRRSLVVAGTHGKTTTTGMLTHVLLSAGRDPGFLVGGVMVNGNVSYSLGNGPHFVVEGDEYDSAYFDKQPKMMHYRPASAVITSLEFDHADIYDDWNDYHEAFLAFARTVSPAGLLALHGDDPDVRALASSTDARILFYGLDSDENDITARTIQPVSGGQQFTLVVHGKEIQDVFLSMSGRHNLRNALAVAAIALDEGLTTTQIADGLAGFKGMKRRQEVRGEVNGVLVIDDFAHHPTAVRETIRAVAERWPGRRLIAVFEPRSNSSRRKVFEEAYAQAFDSADEVFISTPPLRHNDRIEDFLSVEAVVRKITDSNIPASYHPNADVLLPHLLPRLHPGDIALVMSNGSFGGIHEKLLRLLRL